MPRIKDAFMRVEKDGEKGFIPFITAGDPDPQTTLRIMSKLAEMGATVIELGVPFTDPMADGPVIQASSQRALARNSITIDDVLGIVKSFRSESDVPLILFGYMNPFYRFGLEDLATSAAEAGADGLLITDIVDKEFRAVARILEDQGLDLISLVAPTTSESRLEQILTRARGFAYAISTTGITGNKKGLGIEAETLVDRARKYTDIPIAVGFGIATREDVDRVLEFADAVVVGSAIVKQIARAANPDECVKRVELLVSELLSKSDSRFLAGQLQPHL